MLTNQYLEHLLLVLQTCVSYYAFDLPFIVNVHSSDSNVFAIFISSLPLKVVFLSFSVRCKMMPSGMKQH